MYEDTGQLMASLKEGHENAFAYVFKEYYGVLLNYASRILHDAEVANDLVQEVFCRLYEKRGELRGEIDLKPYLYRIVYNDCLNVIKHRNIEQNYVNGELLDFYFSKVIETPEAELALQSEELREAVQVAIQKLPVRCQEIFVLSKIEGLSNKEIAERLGISVKTIENQMTVALSKLRKELEWLLFLIFLSNI